MMFRKVAVLAAAVLAMGGCTSRQSAEPPPTRTTEVTTTTTTPPPTTTTTPAVNADQQVCTGVAAIEARGYQSSAEELLQIGAAGGQSTTQDIRIASAFLSAAATAGNLQQAGETVMDLVATCRGLGLI